MINCREARLALELELELALELALELELELALELELELALVFMLINSYDFGQISRSIRVNIFIYRKVIS
jgi:hypothetical protein